MEKEVKDEVEEEVEEEEEEEEEEKEEYWAEKEVCGLTCVILFTAMLTWSIVVDNSSSCSWVLLMILNHWETSVILENWSDT